MNEQHGERRERRNDRPRHDRPRHDRSRQDGPRRDGPRGDGPRRDGPRHERSERPHSSPELTTERTLVLPGQEIDPHGLRPGFGTYKEEGKVFASVAGILSCRAPTARVIPFAGPYLPGEGDTVIAIVKDVGPSYWLVDLRAYHYAPLHYTGTPWKIEYGECGEYLHTGDALVVMIEGIDPANKRIMVTMNGDGLGKLTGGVIKTVSPTKVPRIIGKAGSMIKMIQQATGVRMVVGQNGRIWVDGTPDGILKARQALQIIDTEGQKRGLTDHIKLFLERKEHG